MNRVEFFNNIDTLRKGKGYFNHSISNGKFTQVPELVRLFNEFFGDILHEVTPPEGADEISFYRKQYISIIDFIERCVFPALMDGVSPLETFRSTIRRKPYASIDYANNIRMENIMTVQERYDMIKNVCMNISRKMLRLLICPEVVSMYIVEAKTTESFNKNRSLWDKMCMSLSFIEGSDVADTLTKHLLEEWKLNHFIMGAIPNHALAYMNNDVLEPFISSNLNTIAVQMGTSSTNAVISFWRHMFNKCISSKDSHQVFKFIMNGRGPLFYNDPRLGKRILTNEKIGVILTETINRDIFMLLSDEDKEEYMHLFDMENLDRRIAISSTGALNGIFVVWDYDDAWVDERMAKLVGLPASGKAIAKILNKRIVEYNLTADQVAERFPMTLLEITLSDKNHIRSTVNRMNKNANG